MRVICLLKFEAIHITTKPRILNSSVSQQAHKYNVAVVMHRVQTTLELMSWCLHHIWFVPDSTHGQVTGYSDCSFLQLLEANVDIVLLTTPPSK